jgi:phage/plasmid-associated DNA primase
MVFTGDEGTGKDTPIDFLMEYVIGKNFSINYQSNSQFFDHYDCGRANKFLVKLEEADRRLCLTNSSFLKSAITADKTTFNPKGKNAYQLPNYNRLIFSTNKANPMEVSKGARRFAIFGCSSELKGKHEYWKELRKVLFTERGGLAVANYLLARDISNFNIRELPVNNYMEQVIESEKSAEERFVEDWDGVELPSSELYTTYRSFCNRSDMEPCSNSITLGKLLLKYVRDGIIRTRKGSGNKTYYSKEGAVAPEVELG